MSEKRPYKYFQGGVDDLLNHVSNMSDGVIDELNADLDGKKEVQLTDEEVLALIQEEKPDLSEEERKQILLEIKLEHLMEIMKELSDLGLAEVTGYDEDGYPTYSLTEKGKMVLDKGKNLGYL
jgi:hypothetical protein